MSLREKIKESPVLGVGLAVMLLGLAAFMFARPGSGAAAGGRWYYDLASGKTEAVQTDGVPGPRPLSSSAMGVPARVFSCAQCDGETFIGYIEKYTAEESGGTPGFARMVAAVPKQGEEPKWFAAESAQGSQVTRAPQQRCGGEAYRECRP